MKLIKPQTAKMHEFIQNRLSLINSRTRYSLLEYAYEECDIVSTFDIVIREKLDHDKKIILVHRIPLYNVKNAVILLSKYAVIEGIIDADSD